MTTFDPLTLFAAACRCCLLLFILANAFATAMKFLNKHLIHSRRIKFTALSITIRKVSPWTGRCFTGFSLQSLLRCFIN
jgi:hypothetical protein